MKSNFFTIKQKKVPSLGKTLQSTRTRLPSDNFQSMTDRKTHSQDHTKFEDQTHSQLLIKYPVLAKFDFEFLSESKTITNSIVHQINTTNSHKNNDSMASLLKNKPKRQFFENLSPSTNDVYIQESDTIKFNGKYLDFYTSKGGVVKNSFETQIRLSSNIITKEVVIDFINLQQLFEQSEKEQGRKLIFQIMSQEREIFLEGQLPQYTDKKINKFKESSIIDQFEILLKLYQNRIDYFSDQLYDILRVCLQNMKNKILSQDRQIIFYFLLTFYQSITFEAFGKVSLAIKTIKHLLYYANIYKIYRVKAVLYYRMASCYIRMNQPKQAFNMSKKLLKLSWYYENTYYENKSYYLLSRCYFLFKQYPQSHFFQERYINNKLEPNNFPRQLGEQIFSASIKAIEQASLKDSRSYDDFELDLVIENEKQTQKQQVYITDKHIQLKERLLEKQTKYPVGDRYRYSSYYYKGQLKKSSIFYEDNQHYKKDFHQLNQFSSNRDLANFYQERSDYIKQNNGISQIYKPQISCPILIQILNQFKNYYGSRSTLKLIDLSD